MSKTIKGMLKCRCCGLMLKEGDFYLKADNKTRVDRCKKCFTKDVKNNNPKTIIPLLKELDRPWIEGEWNDTITRRRARFPEDCEGGQGVFGKYKVNIQKALYKDFRFEDSDKATEVYNSIEHNVNVFTPPTEQEQAISNPDATFIQDTVDLGADLTKEEKKYLIEKWGETYTINECVMLEKQFVSMTKSFEIEDAGRRMTLKYICWTELKASQALEAGNVSAFKDLMGVRDKLMKEGKFTAAQNKEGESNNVNAVGKLVAICEKAKGFIPRFCTDIPQDVVDFTIQDQKQYLYNLVMKDLGFGKQFENTLKKLQKDIEKEKQIREMEMKGETYKEDELVVDLYADLKQRINEVTEGVEMEDDFAEEDIEETKEEKIEKTITDKEEEE